MDVRLVEMVVGMASAKMVFGDIAAVLGVTRNAAIGRYDRIRAKAAKVGKTPLILVQEKVVPVGLNIMAVRDGQCRYPLFGMVRIPVEKRMFCAHPATGSYCETHAAIVYNRGQPKTIFRKFA